MKPYIVKFSVDALYIYKDEVKIAIISNNATWVKEGDEFTKDEIRLYLADLIHPDESVLNILESHELWLEWANKKVKEKPHRYAIVAEIKGPCGHFH